MENPKFTFDLTDQVDSAGSVKKLTVSETTTKSDYKTRLSDTETQSNPYINFFKRASDKAPVVTCEDFDVYEHCARKSFSGRDELSGEMMNSFLELLKTDPTLEVTKTIKILNQEIASVPRKLAYDLNSPEKYNRRMLYKLIQRDQRATQRKETLHPALKNIETLATTWEGITSNFL